MSYRRARRAAWRIIADEMVLLDLEGKRMYGLNPAAAYVWRHLDEVNDLSTLLPENGSIGFGESEIKSFLDQLSDYGLVEHRALDAVSNRSDRPEVLDEAVDPPEILWQEEVEQIAGTCAMFPSTTPICNQAPFS